MGLPPKDTDSNKVLGAAFTVGTESANVINVAVLLQWANKESVDRRQALLFYLAEDANGDTPETTAPSGGIAIGTDGALLESIANLSGVMISEANGKIDINITEVGTLTFRLVLVLPSGDLLVSPAITFA